MDFNTIISIIGIIATLVFGILSIDLFKRKKYPGKITYVNIYFINLLNSIANNFKDLQLFLKNQAINTNIIYIKGAFINNGDIDITSNNKEDNVIKIDLPKNCHWLDFKLTSCSDGMDSYATIEKTNLSNVHFDIMKKNEYIIFEGLVETEKDTKISLIKTQIKTTHRLNNTAPIEKMTLPNEVKIKSTKFLRNSCIFMFIFSSIFYATYFYINTKHPIYYQKIDDSENIYYAKLNKDNLIILKKANNISFKDFFGANNLFVNKDIFYSDYEISPYNSKQKFMITDVVLISATFIAIFLYILLFNIELKSANKIVKTLNLNNN